MLAEVDAGEPGWEPVLGDDPGARKLLGGFAGRAGVSATDRDGASARVRELPDGSVVTEYRPGRTHAELLADWAADGFRLPTSDEWEHLCGAGAGTLYRWGDHAPADCYPAGAFEPRWTRHRRPNAFGLLIAADPYRSELVAEPGLTRGGDGGSTVCGGAGFFLGWLTLATAYFEDHGCRYDPAGPALDCYTAGRRVLELG